MAVTNMWPIKGKVSTLVNYIENPEKTSAQNVKNVLSYIEDDNKTEKMLYVTGINCEPAIAAKQFNQTKQIWGKEGGRAAYHGYQSFREGEVDAETAHRIGVELARRLWGDRFEVVVATHLNTGHYHNHFCLNSVSFADGYKYHDTKEDIKRMRDTSDAICREHDLSIEEAPRIDQNRRRNYREWKDQWEGNPTLRSKIRADMDAAIACSRTEREFASVMRDMGYQFILESETGKWLKYPKIRLPGSNRCVRLKTLGPGYDIDDYRPRIVRNTLMPADPFADLDNIPLKSKIDRSVSRLERAGLRVVITYHGMQLKACVIRRKYREYPPELVKDIRKLDRYVKLQEFTRKNKLDTLQQIESMKRELRRQISVIAERREECRNYAKYWERHNVPVYVNIWKQAAKEKTDQMKPLYQELRMCDELMKTGPLARANAIALVQQRVREEERRRLRKELEKARPTYNHVR